MKSEDHLATASRQQGQRPQPGGVDPRGMKVEQAACARERLLQVPGDSEARRDHPLAVAAGARVGENRDIDPLPLQKQFEPLDVH